MIERIRFANYRVLKEAEIKLGPFNLIVGPNGSGKSTLFHALEAVAAPEKTNFSRIVTAGSQPKEVSLDIRFSEAIGGRDRAIISFRSYTRHVAVQVFQGENSLGIVDGIPTDMVAVLKAARVYALDPSKIAEAAPIQPGVELQRNGANLVAVLDQLRDRDEVLFNELRADLKRFIPEFENIVFETPQTGQRTFKLRQAVSKQALPSSDLSEGTLLALCLLTIAHSPNPPSVICLEEPDRAIHPRLLRDLQDALYRLTFPQDFGLSRKPVQVIATTHSPHFVNLFKDHPEQIIIAEKHADGTASFKNLSEDKELQEMIGDAPLGDVWYSGILGGVPVSA
jgi:predicted ATPase